VGRISCEPCVIVAPVCDCCHEPLCLCSKNKVQQCTDPCFPLDEVHFPGAAPLPRFIEGMVPDVDVNLAFSNHALPGPAVSSIVASGWDTRYNLFSYHTHSDASTYLSAPGSFINDLSNCTSAYNAMVPNPFGSNQGYHPEGIAAGTPQDLVYHPNENLKSHINILVRDLIGRSQNNITGYIPSGVSGAVGIYGRDPDALNPYNELPFYLMKNGAGVRQSISEKTKNILDLINHKTTTSYFFKQKYMTAITKSILIGYFDKYFGNRKIDFIENFSRASYQTRAVPNLVKDPLTASTINLANAKTYIAENRIRMNTMMAGERLSHKILRQYWKFIPSDINLRATVYRSLAGGAIYNASGVPIAGSSLPANAWSWAIKVNDDDTLTTHRQDGSEARVHWIEAEHLRVWTADQGTSSWVPRYQEGCGCCTSGCFVSLCSDRDRSYVFDTPDRTVLLGLLGSVSGGTLGDYDPNPYIELTISAPFETSSDTGNVSGELEFRSGIAPYGTGSPLSTASALHDFYLLTPKLESVPKKSPPWPNFSTDILSGVVNPSNSYVKTTSLEYQLIATKYLEPSLTNINQDVNRAVRYKAGPGLVCFMPNDDPFLYYLNYLWDWNNGNHKQRGWFSVSATIPDLNIDNILGEGERYPRRIPCHILIVPTDQTSKNPLCGKSTIIDMNEGGIVNLSGALLGTGNISRRIKFLPAPTREVLDSDYLKLLDQKHELPIYKIYRRDRFPFGPQGTTDKPFKMTFTASSTSASFNAWANGSERDRRIDPIRKVFDFLTDVSTYYDTRTGITSGTNWQHSNIQVADFGYLTYEVSNSHSLPLLDVWRHLSLFEFNEFVISFKNSIFKKLRAGQFRSLQLFDIPNRWGEKTYLNKYDPGKGTWSISGTYRGDNFNHRNASGVAFIENSLFMNTVKEKDC
jgi:hypothetical protein